MRSLRVAAWQYPIERVGSIAAWQDKLAAGVAHAAAAGAQLAIVPEYASMELTALLSPQAQGDLAAQLAELQPLVPTYVATYAALAREHRIAIVAGSIPERVGDEFRNRARVHGPGGEIVVVEKLQMTRFERERWGVAGGAGQTVIALGDTTIGVAICYDAEFPLIARRLAAAGAEVIAVPSCTDALAGYHRVRVACQARALENQCYVVQAPTVGVAPWSIAVDENVGAAGVYAPPDRGFPADGVVAMGALNEAAWVIAELDLDRVAQVRADGQVLGHRDWDAAGHLMGAVSTARV
ncbi:MAG: carbon-nitrogen hydrolase family protein [Deltaproteobacteria bacterium]|nr:carbon-nitrogen hydrolase family protein [Deltaproteobacteria bacterium]